MNKKCIRCNRSSTSGWCCKAHRQEHAAYERTRRQRNPERIRALDRERNKSPKRRAWKIAYHQKYYAAHRKELLSYQSRYRRDNPERRDNYKRRRRAKEKGLPDTLTIEQWHKILEKFRHRCAYCGKLSKRLEREHKLPASRGGGYTAQNIVPACPICNRRKQNKTDKEFKAFLRVIA